MFRISSFIDAFSSRQSLVDFIKSKWLFPAITTLVLAILCLLQINGSSMGIYHILFYGNQPDKNLIANNPLAIRSDEWIVNTQKTIAQRNNNFQPVNKNVGLGENETLLADAPTTDWSTLFKPHNLGFLFLPFDIAFSLKWWIVLYLLIISSYFFVLLLMPRQKTLAILLSLALAFSPFLQWWYSSGTFGSLYYILFALIAFIKLLHANHAKQRIAWGLALTYFGTCFALILYPPFQIPCLIVAVGFAVGYLLDNKNILPKATLRQSLLFILCSVLVAGGIVGLFLYQKKDIIATIGNTAYPGHRIVTSGGYSAEHLLSSQLSPLFENPLKAASYSRPAINATNPSESSNFIFLLPYLILPTLYLLFRSKKKRLNYSLFIIIGVTLLYFAWLFIPSLSFVGSITLLNRVPHQRLLIGLGLANFMVLVLFIKYHLEQRQKNQLSLNIVYSLLMFIFILIINFHVSQQFPTFLSFKNSILLALPFPIIIFCLIQKHFKIAALLLASFTIASTYGVNPLYRGTSTLTETPISTAIQQVAGNSSKRWIGEEIYLENFATMNGKPSLTGTYLYPQLDIWQQLNQPTKQSIYNRYAHVSFTFNRSQGSSAPPILTVVGDDQFNLKIQPCDPFFKKMNAGFLITTVPFPEGIAPCASLEKTVTYPKISYYIYRLSF